MASDETVEVEPRQTAEHAPESAVERTGLWWSPRCAVPGQEVEAPAIGLGILRDAKASAYEREVVDQLSRDAFARHVSLAFRAHGSPSQLPEYEVRVRSDGEVDRVVITRCSGTPALDVTVGTLLMQQKLPAWGGASASVYLQMVVGDANDFSLTVFEKALDTPY